LFDLDLAELAARARASAAGVEAAPSGPTGGSEDPGGVGTAVTGVPVERLPEPPDTKADAPGIGAPKLQIDTEADRSMVAGDVALDEARETKRPKTQGLGGTVAAALQRRRAERTRYPRGQLRERIGYLRRVRAMLGVVVVTVLLGIAAGTAIGAFLVFVSFAVRSAITSN